jgi:hypothetical protein
VKPVPPEMEALGGVSRVENVVGYGISDLNQ